MTNFGMDYDTADDKLFLWDSSGDGSVVWWLTPDLNSSTWVVHQLTSTPSAHPLGNFLNEVIGKWHYIAELDAFVALDNYTSADPGGVWLFKPDATTFAQSGPLAL